MALVSLRQVLDHAAEHDYGVEVTREVRKFAHFIGVSVEGELGCLGSLEDMVKRYQ